MMKPDPSLLDDVVASKVLDAMRSASNALTALGIRHVVVGGLAVGAHGHPRATKDVNFLVGDEAFERPPGGFVTMKPAFQSRSTASRSTCCRFRREKRTWRLRSRPPWVR